MLSTSLRNACLFIRSGVGECVRSEVEFESGPPSQSHSFLGPTGSRNWLSCLSETSEVRTERDGTSISQSASAIIPNCYPARSCCIRMSTSSTYLNHPDWPQRLSHFNLAGQTVLILQSELRYTKQLLVNEIWDDLLAGVHRQHWTSCYEAINQCLRNRHEKANAAF